MRVRTRLVVIATLTAATVLLVETAAFARFGTTKANAGNSVAAATVSAPTGQSATAQGASRITVSWSAPTQTLGNVVYEVLNTTTSTTPCSNLPSTTTTCTDTGLTSDTAYSYTVVAYPSGTSWTRSSGSAGATTLASDGSGTLTTSTSSVTAGSTGNTIAFTYTAAAGGLSNGAITIAVPTGWTAPVTGNAIGCTSATVGTVSTHLQTITVSGLTLAANAKTVVTYGATSGGSCATSDGATATSTVGAATWQGQQQSSASDTLANLATSPSVTVAAATVSVTAVARSGNSSNYTVSGSVTGSGAVTLTIYSSYNVGTCTAGTVKATLGTTISTGSYTSSTQASLTPGTAYYVKATEGSPSSATSSVYTFTAPSSQSGTTTPSATSC